jgi:hypothetical protein
MLDAMQGMVAKSGVFGGLFRGVGAAVVQTAPYMGINVGAYLPNVMVQASNHVAPAPHGSASSAFSMSPPPVP